MTAPSFWNGDHPLCARLDELMGKHMPVSGKTLHVESELLRASNRISYDYFNNGFGNNMSQAIAYIEAYHLPVASAEFIAAWPSVSECAMRGYGMPHSEIFEGKLSTVAVEIVERLDKADREGNLTPLDREMFDMPYVEMEEPEEDEDEYEDEEAG